MDTSKNDIQVAYEAICEKAKSNKSTQSLKLINEICLEQLQSGEKNFSLANIGEISSQKGGPSTQAIRNKTGYLYRDLIKIYYESIDQPKPSAIRSNKHDWVDQIESQTVRWLVRDLISDKSKLIAEVNQLKVDLLNAEIPIQVFSKNAPNSGYPILSIKNFYKESELNALKTAIDPNYLDRKGLRIGTLGKIEDLTGNVIFKPGFVDSIKKVLELFDEESHRL